MAENILSEWEEYLTERERVNEVGKALLKRTEELFSNEFDSLRSKLPEGYSIDSYVAVDPERPSIVLSPPKKRDGERFTEEERDKIRRVLLKESDRIEMRYGFKVSVIHYDKEDYISMTKSKAQIGIKDLTLSRKILELEKRTVR